MRPGWAVVLFALMAAAGGGFEALLNHLFLGRRFWMTTRLGEPQALVPLFARVSWVMGATWLACRMVNWPLGDANLRDARWWMRAAQGAAVGLVSLCLVVLIPAGMGHEHFRPSTEAGSTIAASVWWTAVMCVAIALAEEIALRGYVLRQMQRAVGRWGAAVGTSVWFGLLHTFNAHATWLAIANIMLAGFWLALTVQRTGSLWLAVGFHFAWNLSQSSLWGEPVSGFPGRESFLVRAPPGDALWTGGGFGPEAGLPNTLVLVALVLLFALWPARRARQAGDVPLV
ncbi:MAG TPA: CPBP family intramembrane glutamic endopeptidase [Myxococcaceae bacterium]|jgi:hypothetical protein